MEPDTVAVAIPDAAGRLIGKRLTAAAWEGVRASGAFSMPDFHLITDVLNAPVPGLEASGAHQGFPNGVLRPDLSTWRDLPWEMGTAAVLCDAYSASGEAAERSPRWVLRRQLERLAERGLQPSGATELEFYLFRTSYELAARSGYRRLRPIYHRQGDNDLLVDGYAEELLGEIRRLMPAAGVPIELSQGEGGVGQFEVTLHHCEPLEMADRHVIYKHGVKTLAQRHGLAATFIAKVRDDQPGSSCHVHLSLRGPEGACALSGGSGELDRFGRAFVAGVLAHAPELCLMSAPYANSYRRLQLGSWAPATVTWGVENRTCLVRICGSPGALLRLEFRLPGADANPYFAFAAIIAAGLSGADADLDLPPPVPGDGYAVDAPLLPRDIAEAVDLFSSSEVAGAAFGVEVRDHIAALGRHERDATRREVTDRDLARCFEVA